MANRRMFSLDVIDTDKFLEMPTSTQALYFQLGMRADDDGFVSSPKRITSLIGASPDDLKLLVAKGFLISFENGVIIIRHWRQNNYVRCDRYTKSVHVDEMNLLTLENGIYNLGMTSGIPTDIPTVYTDKNRIDKNRIDKNNTICSEPDKPAPKQTNKRFIPPSLEDVEQYCRERNNTVDAQIFIDFYESKGWMIGKNKMKDWKAAVRTWEKNDKKTEGVSEPVGNNTYNTDYEWECVKRAIAEAKNSGEPRENIFA